MKLRIARVGQCLFVVGLLLPSLCEGFARAQDLQEQDGAAPQSASAQATAIPDQITAVPNRPTFSTTAESVQPGVFEIEYGFEVADGHQNINGLFKFGATKDLELRFANNPIERDAGAAGMGDSGAGFKYKIFKQKGWRPTFSVLYAATIPTATAGVGVGAIGHSAGILASKDFGLHHLDFNETAQWVGRPAASGYDRNYFTALAYSHPIHGRLGMTAEVAGFSWTNAANPATMTLMGSAIYSVSPRLILDSGIYIAAYGQLPRVTFFGGITYSIADLYHRRNKPNAKAH
jgi:Putative MetA-pathway of phenol degradation